MNTPKNDTKTILPSKVCSPPQTKILAPTLPHTCPVRSTSTAELIAVTFGFCRMTLGSFVH